MSGITLGKILEFINRWVEVEIRDEFNKVLVAKDFCDEIYSNLTPEQKALNFDFLMTEKDNVLVIGMNRDFRDQF